MYNLRLSHLLANHQLANHVWCQHTLPWLWLSRTKGEEGQPAEDKGHRGDVHQDESSPDRKSSRASVHFWFFHRQSREERRILFGDHRPSVGCTLKLDTGHWTVQLDALDVAQIRFTFPTSNCMQPEIRNRLPSSARTRRSYLPPTSFRLFTF